MAFSHLAILPLTVTFEIMEYVKVQSDISNEGLDVSYEISELDSTKDITRFKYHLFVCVQSKFVHFLNKM